MADRLNMEAILKVIPDRYKLVQAAAQRARVLNLGEKALVETKLKNNALIALEEIASGKVKVVAKAVGKSDQQKEVKK